MRAQLKNGLNVRIRTFMASLCRVLAFCIVVQKPADLSPLPHFVRKGKGCDRVVTSIIQFTFA